MQRIGGMGVLAGWLALNLVSCDLPLSKEDYGAEKGHASNIELLTDTTSLSLDGGAVSLRYRMTPQDFGTDAVHWSVDPEHVASVDKKGVVTPHHVGTASVKAEITKLDGKTEQALATFHVVPQVSGFSGVASTAGYVEGNASQARFAAGATVAPLADGEAFVIDWGNKAIRRLSNAGSTTLVAKASPFNDSKDGSGLATQFSSLGGIVATADGGYLVADLGNRLIRKVSPTGLPSDLAGSAGAWGTSNGTGAVARFSTPGKMVLGPSGDLFIRDEYRIRKVTMSGVVTDIAGSTWGTSDGIGTAAQFRSITGLAADPDGNLYVCDLSTIRKVAPDGTVTTLAGSAGSQGVLDGSGSSARFTQLYAIVYTSAGDLVVVDGTRLRRVSLAGEVTTWLTLTFGPNSIIQRASGGFLLSTGSGIWSLTAEGVVTLIAGTSGYVGGGYVDGAGTSARFVGITDLSEGITGDVLVADQYRIRKLSSTNEVTTLAGDSQGYANGDGGTGFSIGTRGWAVADAVGNLYFVQGNSYSDYTVPVVRKMSPSGVVTTIAGTAGQTGNVDGTGASARFNTPSRLVLASNGDLLVLDRENRNIRRVTTEGVVTTEVTLPTTTSVYSAADFDVDADGSLVLSVGSALYRYRDDQWVRFNVTTANSQYNDWGGVEQVSLDSYGQPLFLNPGYGYASYPNNLFGTHLAEGRWLRLWQVNFGGESIATQIAVDADDTLWVVLGSSIQKAPLRRNP